jgi:hypothetical protein
VWAPAGIPAVTAFPLTPVIAVTAGLSALLFAMPQIPERRTPAWCSRYPAQLL